MKKLTKRLITLAIAALMLTTLIAPVTASAAVNYQFKTLKAGTTAQKSYKYNSATGIHYTYYTIKVDKPGQLAFTLSDDGYVYIYNNKNDLINGTYKNSYKSISYRSDCKAVAVEKGTYYLNVSDGTAKYKFTAAPAAGNYCVSKAKTVAASTNTKVMLTPKTNYSRWFKISLPSKKKITYTTNTNTAATSIEIYNTKMQKLETIKNGSDVKYCTKEKQAKGTYYIRVKSQTRYAGDRDYAFGNIYTFKWK